MKRHLLLLLVSLYTGGACMQTLSAQALKATGGSGQYKGDIYWLSFSGFSDLAAGETATRSFQVGDITVTVLIDNVSFSGTPYNSIPLSSMRLVPYRSGSYSGDGLDDMYNIGGTGSANTLTNALSTNYDGQAGVGVFANFRIRAYATLAGQPMDLGLLFANAETDNYMTSNVTEYEQVTTNGTAWKLLEKRVAVTGQSDLQQVSFSNTNTTARIAAGNGNVAILHTLREETSILSPLTCDAQFLCGGKSAIALGLMISTDFGDAPASYGEAVNIFQPTVNGGDPMGSGTFTNYLSSAGASGGTPVLEAGTKADPADLRIGAVAADADVSQQNANADGDDTNGVDDEDGFASTPPDVNLISATYSVNLPVFKNTIGSPVSPRYILAWIDLDRDGIFEPEEYVTGNFTTNNTTVLLPLSWTLTTLSRNAGPSYARFRITSDNPAALTDNPATALDERSVLALTLGETEDYRIQLVVQNQISGNVFDDGNGLTNSLIDGVGTNAGGLVAVLVGSNGKVVANATVSASGAYSFSSVPNDTYSVVLRTSAGTVGQSGPVTGNVPAGWVSTGEGVGTTPDGAVDGVIGDVVISGAGGVSDLNFGIDQIPVADPKSYLVHNSDLSRTPSGGPIVNGYQGINASSAALTGVTNGSLSGSDAEDCPAANTCAAGKTFVINSISSNTRVYYNGVEVIPGTASAVLSGFDVSKLVIYGALGTGTVDSPLSFMYSLEDEAGVRGTPVSYTIVTDQPLPVRLISFFAVVSGSRVQLSWSTSREENSGHFGVFASQNLKDWKLIGEVKAQGQSSGIVRYSFVHETPAAGFNYYRLLMVDTDNSSEWSRTVSVINGKEEELLVYPNPTDSYLRLPGITGRRIQVIDTGGKPVYDGEIDDGTYRTGSLQNGGYLVRYETASGAVTRKFVVRK